MQANDIFVSPEAALDRMVLGRMVLGIGESGQVVSEAGASYGAAPASCPLPGRAAVDQGRPQVTAVPDANPFKGDGDSNGFYLSKSRLNRYISCPRSYFIHYELGVSPLRRDAALLIGLSTHRLITAHHLARKKDEFIDPDALLDDFWSRQAREGDDEAVAQELAEARSASLRYAELFIRDAPLDPLEIERPFSMPLVNLDNGDALPVPLVGVIDLVDRPNGVLRPLEIKTRARKAEDWQVRVALELTCYAWWVRQRIMETGAREPEEIPVGYIHIIKTKTPSIQWQTDTRTVEDFLELYRTARAVLAGIQEGRFYPNGGTHCNWCDFSAVCGKKRDEIVRIFGDAARLRLWEADLI